jgi:hypothetical protein
LRGNFLRGVVLGSATSALVLGASAALAGTGVGGVFDLGQSNSVNQSSSLTGSSSGSELTVSNTSSNSGARGLTVNGSSPTTALLAHNSTGSAASFQTPANVAPFVVNSSVRIPSLNASLLGGRAPSQYLTKGVSAASSTSVALNQVETLTPVLAAPTVSTAGEYYINASIMLIVSSGDTVACVTTVNGVESGPFGTVGPVANQTYETVPIAYSVALSAGDQLGVDCAGYAGDSGTSFYNGGITATLIHSDNGASSAKQPLSKPRTPPPAIR